MQKNYGRINSFALRIRIFWFFPKFILTVSIVLANLNKLQLKNSAPLIWHNCLFPFLEKATITQEEMFSKSLYFTSISILHELFQRLDQQKSLFTRWNVTFLGITFVKQNQVCKATSTLSLRKPLEKLNLIMRSALNNDS